MINGEQLETILIDIVNKKPHRVHGVEAEAMYKRLQSEVEAIHAKGGQVDVPFELPSTQNQN